MKVESSNAGAVSPNVRKLSEQERRKVKERIAQQLSSGAITLGEGVRLMRLAVGMTQAQYAELVGIDIRVLSAIEKDNANPRLETLQRLGRPYGLVVSFVKPQPASTAEPLTVEEWFGSDDDSEKLRKIARILESIAKTANSDSTSLRSSQTTNDLPAHGERLTSGRKRKPRS